MNHVDTMAWEAVCRTQEGFRVVPASKVVLGDDGSGKAPVEKGWPSKTKKGLMMVGKAWRGEFRGCNIAIPTGVINDLVVVDVDSHEILKKLIKLQINMKTVLVKSGRGMPHLYYRAGGIKYRSKAFKGMDVKAEGGCVIAAGSLHYSGEYYKYYEGYDPRSRIIATLPQYFIDMIDVMDDSEYVYEQRGGFDIEKFKSNMRKSSKYQFPLEYGCRNSGLTSLAGCMLAAGATYEEVEEYLPWFNEDREWNSLPLQSVRSIIKSASKFKCGVRVKCQQK